MKIRPSLQKAIDFVESNLESTITEGFNNSILMFGAPGSGKSLAISRICSKANERWNSDPEDPRVVIVRLSGWAHSDERVAFREIARQLCSALKLEYFRTASFGENIQFLLAILKGMADVDKTALFLLEDFDMFARVQRQTFLYCLLDSLQKSDAKAVVVGTTCRYDCMDMLEKRVKSRFSHRSIVLCPPMCLGATKTEAKKRAQAKYSIQIKDEDGAIAILESMLTLPEEYPDSEFSKVFNKATISATRDPKILDSVEKLLDKTNNLHEVANVARWALSDAEMQGGNHIGIHADSITKAISVVDEQYKGFDSLISGLSILELTFLVAAHRVLRKQPDAILNFESILHEFRTYIASGDHVDNYSKTAATKAFDSLQSMGLIAPSRTPCGPLSRRNNNFMPVNLQASRAEIIRGVKDHSTCPMRLAEWCIKESGPGTTARTFLT
jgi:origin recognition complex subunit 4